MRGDYGVDNPRGKGRAREGNVRRSALHRPEDEFRDEVVSVGPVSKTVKGGRRRSFRALVVVGNGKVKLAQAWGKP